MTDKDKVVVSENFQSIYAFRQPMLKNKFGQTRVMEELGVIKGLSKLESKNYILIPLRVTNKHGVEETTSWSVYELPKDHDIEPVSWKNLHAQEETGEGTIQFIPKGSVIEKIRDVPGSQQ